MQQLISQYFVETVQHRVVGLLINDVWYGRPWDEYWIFDGCSYVPETDELRIDFQRKNLVVHSAQVSFDEDGYLVIRCDNAVLQNYRNFRRYESVKFTFVYQKDPR